MCLTAVFLFDARCASAAGVTGADQVCGTASDPCIVDRVVDVEPGAVLMFGSRALQVTGRGQLRVGSGQMKIRCGSLSVAQGGKITGLGSISNRGGSVQLEVEAGAAIIGDIDVSGASAGAISITVGGAFGLNGGRLLAAALAADGAGGSVEAAADAAALGGSIRASGGTRGSGGEVTIEAATSVIVSGSINASGGEEDAGEVDIASGGNVVFTSAASVLAEGRSGGSGGAISVVAGDPLVGDAPDGSLVLAGTLSVLSGSNSEGAGDGGQIALGARDGCRLGAKLVASGGSPDGNGGEVSVDCGSTAADATILSGDVVVRGLGAESMGGAIFVSSDGALQVQSKLDVGGFAAGTIELASDADLVATSSAIVSGDGEGAGSTGGSLRLRSCASTIAAGAKLTAAGRAGSILLSGATRLDIAGLVSADSNAGSIQLVYRDTYPSIQSTAVIKPAPTVRQAFDLPACSNPTPRATATQTVTPSATATPTSSGSPPITITGTRRIPPSSTPTRTPRDPATTPSPPAGRGDANCDGVIDSLDVNGPTRAIFDARFLEDCRNADTNGNGRADAGDYPGLALLRQQGP